MASYQAYRNLHKPGFFSIKHKGIVVDYAQEMIMTDCRFHVSESGREKTVEQRRKRVHAWVVGQEYSTENKKVDMGDMEELWYSPYFTQKFMGVETGKIYESAEMVLFKNNKCYASKATA